MKREDCIGCQFCTDVAPDVFRMNGESAECFGDVTESNIDAATEAAEGCPVGAIEIE
ncbi:ferredoxin [Ruminococcus difficilis]|uniref:Ferredoxin n=1 Tax=Ruminococcus difficilis TaxID=2763069 RepID=A0A934TYA2_9FIRM|nr:ferredoxin [Ruminococcus difficilis]MBK6087497.1 ferredoxin [Ruminococcus difficilis]